MAKRPKSNGKEIVCPCCKTQRAEGDLSYLFKWRKQYDIPFLGMKEAYAKDPEEKLRWACDICIRARSVTLADPEKQDYSIFPYFVYLDLDRECKSCGKDYVYTKEEQFFWYEELGNNFWSRANNCLDCRREKRKGNHENTRLSGLIANLDENKSGSLSEVVEAYLEMGKLEKAKFYMSKLRKLARKVNFDYSDLESRIANS